MHNPIGTYYFSVLQIQLNFIQMKNIIASILITSAILGACTKTDTTESLTEKTDTTELLTGKTIVINATSSNDWVYFSFDKDTTVNVSDAANSLDWDLAFRRSWIKTNSGLSGKGMGGAFNSGLKAQTGFDGLTTVPTNAVFVQDDSTMVAGSRGFVKDVVNPVIKDCFELQFGAQTLLIPGDSIYVVKTASGKYAKVWIKDYYSETEANVGAYIKMTYKYQSDGTKSLE